LPRTVVLLATALPGSVSVFGFQITLVTVAINKVVVQD
jgi:hypothetical protein